MQKKMKVIKYKKLFLFYIIASQFSQFSGHDQTILLNEYLQSVDVNMLPSIK